MQLAAEMSTNHIIRRCFLRITGDTWVCLALAVHNCPYFALRPVCETTGLTTNSSGCIVVHGLFNRRVPNQPGTRLRDGEGKVRKGERNRRFPPSQYTARLASPVNFPFMFHTVVIWLSSPLWSQIPRQFRTVVAGCLLVKRDHTRISVRAYDQCRIQTFRSGGSKNKGGRAPWTPPLDLPLMMTIAGKVLGWLLLISGCLSQFGSKCTLPSKNIFPMLVFITLLT